MDNSQFWESIFGDGSVTGYVGFGLFDRKKRKMRHRFYEWPANKPKLDEVLKYGSVADLYFCPSILREPSLKKTAVLGSWVTWVDDPGCIGPPQGPTAPSASIVVQSGSAGHTHQYWRSERFLTPSETEAVNRQLRKSTGGDPSGIDACQLLRVPGTFNHKTTPPKPVATDYITVRSYNFDNIIAVTEPPPPDIKPVSLVDVLLNRQLPTAAKKYLQEGYESLDRSNDLMHFAYLLAEHGFSRDDSYALLEMADIKWGKFTERDDKELRLQEIVDRASVRFSEPLTIDLSLGLAATDERRVLGWNSLLKSDRKVEWVVEDFLRKRGFTLLIANTGVGKSTFALNLAVSLFLVDEFLKKKVTQTNEKVLYVSTEMAEEEVKYFIELLSRTLPPDVIERLEDHVHFYAPGHAIYLNDESGRDVYEELLSAGGYTGVVIDTLSASTSGSLSEESVSRPIADFIDKTIRGKYGCWVVLLHHPRKTTDAHGRNRAISIDDTYGARIMIDRANTVLHLDRAGRDNTHFILNTLKGRFSASNAPIFMRKTTSLWFEPVESLPTPSVAAAPKKKEEITLDTDIDFGDASSQLGLL